VHDREGIYGNWLPNILKNYGFLSLKTPPKSPWCNPHVERFNRTLKDEILHRVAIVDNQQPQQLCGEFKNYYNAERPHQGIVSTIHF
jgi:transposase InsO family protein